MQINSFENETQKIFFLLLKIIIKNINRTNRTEILHRSSNRIYRIYLLRTASEKYVSYICLFRNRPLSFNAVVFFTFVIHTIPYNIRQQDSHSIVFLFLALLFYSKWACIILFHVKHTYNIYLIQQLRLSAFSI